MKILINCMNVGIGPNGGSRTLIRSANTLQKLGHDVQILNDKLNHNYTWDKIEVPLLVPKNINDIPNADVVMGTGYNSWKKTIDLPDRCGKKLIWVRLHETHQAKETELIKVLSNKKLKIIVNSICLKDKLQEFNIDSKIIRPGYDFHEIQPLHNRQNNKILTIGGLYSKGKKREIKRVPWIINAIKEIKTKMKINLIMFGADGAPNVNDGVDLFIPNPNPNRKNEIYNKCNIWVAPTCNDGLHMPPAEAMQSECCVVGTDAPMSGMQDYLINKETGIVSFNNYESFKDCIMFALLLDEETRIKYGKVAREKILSLGTREYNMNILINYIEDNM